MEKILAKALMGVIIIGSTVGMTTAAYATSTTSTPPDRTVDLACIRAAVTVRETAIITAYSTLSTAITTALNTRKTALQTAWGITNNNARRTAIVAAHQTFQNTSRTAATTYRTARNDAWSTFRTATRACRNGANVSNDDTIRELNVTL